MTKRGQTRMATSTSSYTTAPRHCQQCSDSPAPSPGPFTRPVLHRPRVVSRPLPSSWQARLRPTTRRRCRKAPWRASGRPVLHPQVHPVCSTAASGSVPTGAPSFTLGRRRTASPPAGSTDGSERPSHDPRERRPSMMPAIREQTQSGPHRRRTIRRDPARNPDSGNPAHPGKPALSRGQPWW